MGFVGGNDSRIKVSQDGLAWTDAMIISADSGLADGAAV